MAEMMLDKTVCEQLTRLERELHLAGSDAEEAAARQQSAAVALKAALRRALVSLGEPLDSVVCVRCGRVSAPPAPGLGQSGAQPRPPRCPCRG